MQGKLKVSNSLSGKKEEFVPLKDNHVGMYVCGPTVYSSVHLGNCRTFVSFDIIYRYLLYKGYKVRYVRNITDVGHLLDDGEDRISKGARLEQLEPMEIVQKYTNGFHDVMRLFNALPPSIEPRATGHIIEQIEMVRAILNQGYGYEINGSVYFDTQKFAQDFNSYGKLSGRIIEDLLVTTRDDLKKQDEKRHPSDFAIWMKAQEDHIMRWDSPWGEGFPGWHLECSVMSTKYLGPEFDIHGGGNDLKFPHHENEIAQNVGACGCQPARYWIHTNMLLMNGKKMSKSDGNTISPEELFSGNSPHVSKGYSPMVVRFFILQSHYSSTLDLTDGALAAAEKGYNRLMDALDIVPALTGKATSETPLDEEVRQLIQKSKSDMDDDFNTPKALASIFELVTKINGLQDRHISLEDISNTTLQELNSFLNEFIFDVFGLAKPEDSQADLLDGVMDLIIDLRAQARSNKDWGTADQIRDALQQLHIQLKDGSDGTKWSKN